MFCAVCLVFQNVFLILSVTFTDDFADASVNIFVLSLACVDF